MAETSKSMSGLISVFLLCIVGLALTGTVVTSVTTSVAGVPGGYNLSGPGLTMMNLFPMFWVILMIAIPVAYVAIWLRK